MAQREDLAAFERGFLAVDRSFSPDARAKANKRLAALFADAGTISDTRFVLALSEIAALADNGHTGVIYRGVTVKSLDPARRDRGPFGENRRRRKGAAPGRAERPRTPCSHRS